MPGPSAFDLVMGTPEEALQKSNENFEHQCVKQLMRGFGMPPKRLAFLERANPALTCEWFSAEYPEWEVQIAACRVREYSLQGLFERPAANPVMEAFVENFGTGELATPRALFFKATGWTKLAMSRGADWLTDRHNFLNLCVHGARYRVCPLEEFIHAYPQRFLAPAAV